MTCKACGRPEPGPLPPDALAVIVGPKERPVIGGGWEDMCWNCFIWQASVGRVIV